MINNIITYLDDKIGALNLFSDQIGLCEIIKEINEAEEEKSYPAKYVGKGEYKAVGDFDLSDGLLYFRKIGNVTEDIAESQVACRTNFVRNYPIRIVAAKKKSIQDDEFIADALFEEVRNTIEGQSIKELKTLLKAVKVNILIEEYNTDREAIFEDEYDGIEAPFPYDLAFVAIDIIVEVTATKQCFVNICDPPEDSLLCLLINKASVADIDACLVGSGKKGEVCGTFNDATVFKSNGSTIVVTLSSGQTFTIPKHNILLPDATIHQSDEYDEDFQLLIVYNYPDKGGAFISQRVGDDHWAWANIFNNGVLPAVGQRALVDSADFTKLLTKNAFGTLERFTNDVGTTTSYNGGEGETVEYTIDHYTGLGWLTVIQTMIAGGNGNRSWNNAIDDALAWTQGAYDDFILPSRSQIVSIIRGRAGSFAFNYPPFNSNTNTTFWSSSTAIRSSLQAYRSNRYGECVDDVKTGTRNAYYCRKHY